MIKVFTLNKNNKIELTKQELEKLLNESFWEGYRYKNSLYWTYTSPLVAPCTTQITSANINNPYTINSCNLTSDSITVKTKLGD